VLGHPRDRALGVHHRFGGGEGLGRDHQQRRGRIEQVEHILQRHAVDIGDDRDVVAIRIAPERIDQQMRPQRRSADPDVEDMPHRPERIGLDRVDQRAHPRMIAARAAHAFGIALAALGGVLDRAILGDVDMRAAEHRLALAGKIARPRQCIECRDHLGGKMRLGKIEMDPRDIERQAFEPPGIRVEQLGELLLRQCRDRRPVRHDPPSCTQLGTAVTDTRFHTPAA